MSRVAKVVDRYRTTYGTAMGLVVLALRVLRLGAGTPVRAASTERRNRPVLRMGTSDEMAYVQVFGKLDYDIDYGSGVGSIIDAGANVGYASIWFAERYPSARILAIEPDPENFALLVRNTRPYPQVRAVQAALAVDDGWVQLVDPGIGHWGIRVADDPPAVDAPGAIIRSISVPTAFELLGCDVVDILKIDIEGSEREVLADASAWIDSVNAMVVEVHEGWAPGARAAFEGAAASFDERGKLGENRYAVRAPAHRRVA